MRHHKLLLAIAAFILIPLGFYFFVKKRNTKKLVWHATRNPITKDLTQFITASGSLKAQDQITIGSLVAGRIVKLLADDNDFVKKDQVLVELDDGIGYSSVKKATAALLQAKASFLYIEKFYARQTALFESGQLAQDTFEGYTKDFETAKAQVLASEAELEIRQQGYDNLFIKTPEDGIVIAKKVDLGQMVTARLQATELFIIAKDLTKMEAEIDIDESDVGAVKVGQEAVFTVDSFPQKPFTAKVTQINYDYKVVENVITYGVILNVSNPDLTLRPGMTTNVSIKTAKAEKALCVLNKALRVNRKSVEAIAQKEDMFVQNVEKTVDTKSLETLWLLNGKTFKEVIVKTGITDGKYTQIIEGISASDNVVVEALDPNRENPVLTMGNLKV